MAVGFFIPVVNYDWAGVAQIEYPWTPNDFLLPLLLKGKSIVVVVVAVDSRPLPLSNETVFRAKTAQCDVAVADEMTLHSLQHQGFSLSLSLSLSLALLYSLSYTLFAFVVAFPMYYRSTLDCRYNDHSIFGAPIVASQTIVAWTPPLPPSSLAKVK